MSEVIYPISTAFAVVGWLLVLRHAWGNTEHLVFLGAGAIYGYALEKAAIVIFHIYSYPTDEFIFEIGGLPVSIPLAWSVILYSGLITGKHLRLPAKALPIFTALYALHFDLAIDAIAIRVPFWSWHPPGPWFGVPLANFVAWLSVPFLFISCILFFRKRLQSTIMIHLIAMVASAILLILVVQLWMTLVMPSLTAQVVCLALLILGAAAYLARVERTEETVLDRPSVEPFVAMLLFHVFYLGVLVTFGFYRQTPQLLYISIAMVLGHVATYVVPDSRLGKGRLINALQTRYRWR